MKIPKHISDYLMANPPKTFRYKNSANDVLFELKEDGYHIKPPSRYLFKPYGTKERFDGQSNAWTEDYVNSIISLYMKCRWTEEIQDICNEV